MYKLKITTDREFSMEGIESCTEIGSLDGKKIDYAYGDVSQNDYRYFEVEMSGITKIVAIAGDVELIEVPIVENIIQTYDKKVKT